LAYPTLTEEFKIHLYSFSSYSVVIDPDEDAVSTLSEHFKQVITGICNDTWKHYSLKLVILVVLDLKVKLHLELPNLIGANLTWKQRWWSMRIQL